MGTLLEFADEVGAEITAHPSDTLRDFMKQWKESSSDKLIEEVESAWYWHLLSPADREFLALSDSWRDGILSWAIPSGKIKERLKSDFAVFQKKRQVWEITGEIHPNSRFLFDMIWKIFVDPQHKIRKPDLSKIDTFANISPDAEEELLRARRSLEELEYDKQYDFSGIRTEIWKIIDFLEQLNQKMRFSKIEDLLNMLYEIKAECDHFERSMYRGMSEAAAVGYFKLKMKERLWHETQDIIAYLIQLHERPQDFSDLVQSGSIEIKI